LPAIAVAPVWTAILATTPAEAALVTTAAVEEEEEEEEGEEEVLLPCPATAGEASPNTPPSPRTPSLYPFLLLKLPLLRIPPSLLLSALLLLLPLTP